MGRGDTLPNTKKGDRMGILIFGLGIMIGTLAGIILASLSRAAKDGDEMLDTTQHFEKDKGEEMR